MSRIAESPTIKETYPLTGILTSLKSRKTSDWLDATSSDDIASLELYIKTSYGERHLNSLGQLLAESTVDTNGVADMIYILHSGAWNHLWESYVAEYNPIWNVDGTTTDTETRDLTKTYTGTDTNKKSGNEVLAQSGTDTVGKTGSDTTVREGTNTNDNQYYGFDSSTAVPTTTQVQTPDLTDTLTYGNTETETKNLTDTKTYNNVTDQQTKNLTDTDSGSVTHETVHQGNIGTTMTSQMLRDDTDYWSDIKSLFYEHVIKDIIGDICYKIYVES